jgi:hypothetical protein
MSDTHDTPPEEQAAEPELPPYVIEGARSSRSRCKACRRKIDKGTLRLGVLIEGPFGTGYLWHHLNCAARRRFDDVEAAYESEAWNAAKEPPSKLPKLEMLRGLREQAEQRRATRKTIPYAELDPSGRAKCKHCGETMQKGDLRVVLGRAIEFGSQVRTAPIQVHIHCVSATLKAEDCNTEIDGFEAALRANSSDLTPEQIDSTLSRIGPLAAS